jgi:hypothetical protein
MEAVGEQGSYRGPWKRDLVSPYLLVVILIASISANFCLGQTLGEALNATNLTWATSGTGGATGWSFETTRTHDGISAAQSSTLYLASQTSILQTTVTGPGTLSFWWTDASLYNQLSFIAGGTTLASIISYPSWQQQTINLGPGSQTLQWVYAFSFSDGVRGYLDQVNYCPGATAPVIVSQPLSQSQVPGFSTTFTVGARGTPPLSLTERLQLGALA